MFFCSPTNHFHFYKKNGYTKLFVDFSCRKKELDDLDTNRLATAPRPGTTLRPEVTAQNPQQLLVNSRPRTLSGRPISGMVKNLICKTAKQQFDLEYNSIK